MSTRSPEPGPGAGLAGFVALIPANALASALRKGTGKSDAPTWLLSQASGAGHLLVCGLLSAALLLAWFRVRPARIARFDLVAFGALAATIGALALGPDFDNFVERVEAMHKVPARLLGALFCMVFAVGLVLAVRPLARRYPWLAVGVGVAVAFANNFLLELDYPGIHLTIGWCGALAATLGLAARDLALLRPSKRLAIVMGVLAPLGIASLIVRPSESAWRKLLEAPGAFPAPFVSELLPDLQGGGDADDPADPPAKARDGATATPPSGLSPLGADGIVILLVCDALRADAVARERPLVAMPNLERLRERSIEFTMARSAGSTTHASMSTLFTGKYYSGLRSRGGSKEEGNIAADKTPRVVELLAPDVGNFHVFPTRLLSPKQGATRGFDAVKVKDKAPSSEVMPKVKERFAKGIKGPFLLYMHWMDAHAPYDLDGTHGTPKEAYLREVAIVDKRLGELLSWLDEAGLTDRTTLIVTADHGEAFGEHGFWEHGKAVYEELLRVPLLIAAPGKSARVVDAPVSTIDLGPTILDLFGRPVPAHFMGESLLPLAYGRAKGVSHPIAAEASYKARAFYSSDDIKVIFDRLRKTTEVYDLADDPGETKNLADSKDVKKHIRSATRFWAAQQVAKEAVD